VKGNTPGSLRVLIADDNRDGADSCAILLQQDGHAVCVAYSGEDALALGARFRPQLMLVDLAMPGMDGYSVARQVRDCEWGSAVILVAVSGQGGDDLRRRLRDSGFDHHLVKPVEIDSLRALLKECAYLQG